MSRWVKGADRFPGARIDGEEERRAASESLFYVRLSLKSRLKWNFLTFVDVDEPVQTTLFRGTGRRGVVSIRPPRVRRCPSERFTRASFRLERLSLCGEQETGSAWCPHTGGVSLPVRTRGTLLMGVSVEVKTERSQRRRVGAILEGEEEGRDGKGRGWMRLGVSCVAALMLTDGVMNSVRSLRSSHADRAD